MKIGDEVYVRGTVDVIGNDTVLIKNEGGCFATVKTEVIPRDQGWDEVVFDADEFCLIVDKDKIYIFRRGRNKVKVKRPIPNIPERTDFYGL